MLKVVIMSDAAAYHDAIKMPVSVTHDVITLIIIIYDKSLIDGNLGA